MGMTLKETYISENELMSGKEYQKFPVPVITSFLTGRPEVWDAWELSKRDANG